jgi:hypothetical protein
MRTQRENATEELWTFVEMKGKKNTTGYIRALFVLTVLKC